MQAGARVGARAEIRDLEHSRGALGGGGQRRPHTFRQFPSAAVPERRMMDSLRGKSRADV